MKTTELTNYHLLELQVMENFSERTKNVCINFSLDTLYKLLGYYFEHQTFLDLKNCGKKSNDELVRMLDKYIREYNITPETLQHEGHHRTFEEYKQFCFEYFGLSSHEADTFRHAFVEEKFPLFDFSLVVLKKVLSDREFFLFENNFGFIKGKSKLTLQSVADIYGVTRERIRQIAQQIPYKVREILSAFSNDLAYIKNHIRYKLKKNPGYLLVDNATADKINAAEELEFTPRFYALVFSILYHDKYTFFQENITESKNYYLIENKFSGIFDFENYLLFLNEKNQTTRKTDQTVSLDTLLKPYYLKQENYPDKEIEKICIDIATEEFGFYVDPERNMVFPRTTHIRISERILQILTEAGRPMHLKEISEKLRQIMNDSTPNIESLRASILIIDEVAAIGKTSTYSLKSWEHIKTATIKQLAREYLEKQEQPVPLTDVVNYITQYRNTNFKNVYSNLKLDKNGIFVFFKGGLIGLSNKEYAHRTTNQLRLFNE